MVPKQADEAQEGTAGRERDKRTGEARTRRTGQNEAATARETGQDGTPWPPCKPPSRSTKAGFGQKLGGPPESRE